MRNYFIVGPSCGGKTTLLHYLREHVPEANIPHRYLTRRPRNEHDALENGFLSQDNFLALREQGKFYISWHRVFADRLEYYGFLKDDVSQAKVNIFSANNALLLYPDSILPAGVLDASGAKLIACIASEGVRAERLKVRSPEYDEVEAQTRIHGESIDHLLNAVDLVLDTATNSSETNGQIAKGFVGSTGIEPVTLRV